VQAVTVLDAGGCHRCEGTGYKGRVGLFELMTVDGRLRELLARRAPADVLREAACAQGMVTLAQDAWNKVRSGQTSVREVRPLLGLLMRDAAGCPTCGAPSRPAFRSCPECGTRLRRICACGAGLEARWQHCPRCGEPAGTNGALEARPSPRGMTQQPAA
jgi:type IV pilus assembly protein PilB